MQSLMEHRWKILSNVYKVCHGHIWSGKRVGHLEELEWVTLTTMSHVPVFNVPHMFSCFPISGTTPTVSMPWLPHHTHAHRTLPACGLGSTPHLLSTLPLGQETKGQWLLLTYWLLNFSWLALPFASSWSLHNSHCKSSVLRSLPGPFQDHGLA